MPYLLFVLTLAIELAFAALAVRTAVAWLRHRDRSSGYLALALGALAIDILIAPALTGTDFAAHVITDVDLVVFLASGYGLVMFRDSFVPYGPTARRAIPTALIATALLAIAVQLPASPDSMHSPLQTIALVAVLGLWSFCILEPLVTFWIAARGRSAVEKARLRAFSAGYAGVLLVFVIGTIAGSLSDTSTLLLDLVALAMVPVLYVAFFPPVWLRRFWRQPEEDDFRHALHDLLMYSPDRETLADRALGWAERLVGGEAAFIVDADGTILASRGISPAEAKTADDRGSLVRAPLVLREGRGALVIVSGRSSPLFGDDELDRLSSYATSISAGLDRVSLYARVSALERAKTDFLNIASHELRGPMTVIKGYLTMLDDGALGELSPKARAVLPLLVSKSDEVSWMLEQMIEASRLDEGMLALKRHRADVVELTDSAIDGVRLLLGGHELRVDLPADAIEAEVDPDRFQIVVRNLLSNAAKYSPSGTEISVGVRRADGHAAVTVKDNGAGISSEDQARLFTRFGRIESGAGVQGTGLGLWLSREIARMHNGDLIVNSSVGAGSTFTFTVPLSN